MYSGAGLETGGGIRRSPEVSELGGDIEKLFFQIFVDFVLPKINQKGLKAYVSRCLGFFTFIDFSKKIFENSFNK